MGRIGVFRLAKEFSGKAVVDTVTFEVGNGEFCVLLGPSGCGKSTTLRLIAGLEEPTSGRVEIEGRDVTGTAARDRRIAMIFQSYALFPHLSVAENIVFGLRVRRVGRAERDRRLAKVAALTGLADLLQRKPAQISGGQRQRVALARAIVGEQPVCLMDEPLSNLDAQLRHDMRVEIRALQQRLGMTIVYVTHDQIEAMAMADQVLLMRDGRIEQAGTPDALYERPATTFAARFIGSPGMNLIAGGTDGATDGYVRGVRAEHVQVVEPAADVLRGEVTSIEYLGADTVVTLRSANGDSIAARAAGRLSLRVGEPTGIAWNPAHEHRFDSRSGRRVDAPARPRPGAFSN